MSEPSPERRSRSNGHAADGLEEGSSKSVSEELAIVPASVDGQTPVLEDPQPMKRATGTASSRSTLLMAPPNPFLLQRSHSSFTLASQKMKSPDPESTREMLTRIAWLAGQSVKASEEKLGIATAAYNLVSRINFTSLTVAHQHCGARWIDRYEVWTLRSRSTRPLLCLAFDPERGRRIRS